MKVVILAGGLGTRISEETHSRPKPMIEVGGKPLLWHIMKMYTQHGFTDFIICLGYMGYYVKEYFSNYKLHTSDVTYDFVDNKIVQHNLTTEPWRVTLVDTGANTMTGGRLKRVKSFIGDQTFMMTYGDGLADVNISELAACHRAHKKLATVTAVQPPGRFGVLEIDEASGRVDAFREKPRDEIGWINGGFFVLEPEVLDLIDDDSTSWESEPLERLASSNQLHAYKHRGFWQPVDTLRDKRHLEDLWAKGSPPWKGWD